MRNTIIPILFCLLLALAASETFSQTQVGIPIKEVKGFVLEFNAPFDRILIDVDPNDNNFTKEELITVAVTAEPSRPSMHRRMRSS